jgi:octaprenyl-diphosphate synthase
MEFVRNHHGIDYAQLKSEELIAEALSILDQFEESPYKQALKTFARFVIERKS